MCGIIGIISQKPIDIKQSLIASLRRMDYRGYDSAGVAVWLPDGLQVRKAVGDVANLKKACELLQWTSRLGIGHTRWATHGKVSELNAHPHVDGSGKIMVAHNGTIENYQALKQMLTAEGFQLQTATDTEVIPFLVQRYFARSDGSQEALIEAFQKALMLLNGTYGIVMIHHDFPGLLLAARQSSPVLIGQGNDEIVVASDAQAVLNYTKQVYWLNDGEIAIIQADDFEIRDTENRTVAVEIEELEIKLSDADKKDFEHFMLKEIYDQPQAIEDAIAGRLLSDNVKLGGLEKHADLLRKAKRVVLVGCGTAFYAAKIGEYAFEEIAGIPAKCEKGSEFACREPVFDEETVYFFVSQSGETADTLQALRKVKAKGLPAFGVVNVVSSTIARETDAGVYCRVGPEIAVASTKAFTGQVVVLLLIAIMMGRQRHLSSAAAAALIDDLCLIPDLMRKVLARGKEIKAIAEAVRDHQLLMFLGRKFQYPVALEGALKLKEVAYVATEGFPSGEMKHGPLAMVNDRLLSIFLIPRDSVRELNLSNLNEIKARQGLVFAIASDGEAALSGLADLQFTVPKISEPLTPLLTTIPLQLLSYYSAVLRGHNVDKPRNLAKSVTVK